MATGAPLSLIDLANSLDPAGETIEMAELLSMADDLMEYMVWKEGNTNTGHIFRVRTSIPQGWWRFIGQGVPMAKTTSAQGRMNCGMLEENSTIDRKLVDMAGSGGSQRMYRYQEDNGIVQGMGQNISGTFFYGNQLLNPASFNGFFTAFYNTVNPANSPVAANVFDGGGLGSSNASIMLAGFSPRSIYGVFPKGSKAGLTVEPLDYTELAYDALGNPYRAMITWFKQEAGLCVEDWRWGVRYCNLDVTGAGLGGGNAPDIFATMTRMVLRLPKMARNVSGITETDAKSEAGLVVRPVFLTNRNVRGYMDIQAIRQPNVLLGPRDYAGSPIENWRGVPIGVVDKMLSTETRVT